MTTEETKKDNGVKNLPSMEVVMREASDRCRNCPTKGCLDGNIGFSRKLLDKLKNS